jgi:hypothetical protein
METKHIKKEEEDKKIKVFNLIVKEKIKNLSCFAKPGHASKSKRIDVVVDVRFMQIMQTLSCTSIDEHEPFSNLFVYACLLFLLAAEQKKKD